MTFYMTLGSPIKPYLVNQTKKIQAYGYHLINEAFLNMFASLHENYYRISSNKRPQRILNFETVRCGTY